MLNNKDIKKLNNSFIPYITLSFGMSLDGKIATKTGDSKYISGDLSREFIHDLRDSHDGILVGVNTVLIDNPSLTTRLKNRKGKDAIRIVLDSELKIQLDKKIINQTSDSHTLIVTNKNSDNEKKELLKNKNVRILEVDDTRNLYDVLRKIKDLGINSVLVEGGSTIHFSFIEKGLFDRLYATISPIIIGGESAKTAVGGSGFSTLTESMYLDFIDINKYGEDFIIEAIPKKERRNLND